MFKIKHFQKLVLFITCLVVSSFISANQERQEWTSFKVCQDFALAFDKRPLDKLLEKPGSVIEVTGVNWKPYEQGCHIVVSYRHKSGSRGIANVWFFRQSNALAIYTDIKRNYLTDPTRQTFINKDKSSSQIFPWLEEGFIEYRSSFTEFSAYTTKKDLLIFSFRSEFDPEMKELDSKFAKKPMKYKLSKRFVEFITIFIDQFYP